MPQAANALFTAADLTGWLRQPVQEEAAWITETVVWGWLSAALGVETRPESPSEQLKAWAIELGGIAYANPEGLGSYALESEKSVYSGERRAAILRAASGGSSDGAGVPSGSFPCAEPYPDPAIPPRPCW